MPIRPSKNLRAAYKKCDHYFSQYIRLKYADKNGNVKCYTCESVKPIKEMDNGHFCGRWKKNVRWDERNCRPQCPRCNRFLEQRDVFAGNLLKELGRKEFEKLIQDGNKIKHWKIWEVNELSQIFAIKVKELKNVKLKK